MLFHEALRSLRTTIGARAFEDPDGFRAAVDDFMDERTLSTGQINLLVDALRLGAYARTVRMIDSGVEPPRAVEAAGDLLSRDRGSGDLSSSRWACAVLGYAVGKVDALDVERFTPHAHVADDLARPGFVTHSEPIAPSWQPDPGRADVDPTVTAHPSFAPPSPTHRPPATGSPSDPSVGFGVGPPGGRGFAAPTLFPDQTTGPPGGRKGRGVVVALSAVAVVVVAALATATLVIVQRAGDPGADPSTSDPPVVDPDPLGSPRAIAAAEQELYAGWLDLLGETQAQCYAKAYVDEFGVRTIVDMGQLTEELEAPEDPVAEDPDIAARDADLFLGCVDRVLLMQSFLGITFYPGESDCVESLDHRSALVEEFTLTGDGLDGLGANAVRCAVGPPPPRELVDTWVGGPGPSTDWTFEVQRGGSYTLRNTATGRFQIGWVGTEGEFDLLMLRTSNLTSQLASRAGLDLCWWEANDGFLELCGGDSSYVLGS